MMLRPFNAASLRQALQRGWVVASATRSVGILYSLCFVAGGALIGGLLLWQGWLPFMLAAAGAFMLIGPVILAGFFGMAAAWERDGRADAGAVLAGFRAAAPALWVLSLVCALLFMIFVTDAAILYAYMVGGEPVLSWGAAGVERFVLWSAVSGLVVALLLFAVSAFAVPLLCERRCGLVAAVATSVRLVFGNLPWSLLWGAWLGVLLITSALLLPLLPLTLPWLACASRELYKEVLPAGV
ncbi:DUF2189 domain-containing protein [Dechloromonas sp. ZY10]|uniref:DUF2189 domain-containing protein n=1 Tax=Dechloromonas aquae TaxID=2664436 RepID=UPI003527025E